MTKLIPVNLELSNDAKISVNGIAVEYLYASLRKRYLCQLSYRIKANDLKRNASFTGYSARTGACKHSWTDSTHIPQQLATFNSSRSCASDSAPSEMACKISCWVTALHTQM